MNYYTMQPANLYTWKSIKSGPQNTENPNRHRILLFNSIWRILKMKNEKRWRRRAKQDWNLFCWMKVIYHIKNQDISKNNNNSNKTKMDIRNIHTVYEIRSFSWQQILTLFSRWNTNNNNNKSWIYLSVRYSEGRERKKPTYFHLIHRIGFIQMVKKRWTFQ